MRIGKNEDTMHVNLQLENGERIDAIVRVDDADKVYPTPSDGD
jgi:hypothetical protein